MIEILVEAISGPNNGNYLSFSIKCQALLIRYLIKLHNDSVGKEF